MKTVHPILVLFGIVVLAVVLRFFQLGNVPPSPDWDEAALGYNAYSILKTGRDEYGVFLPRELRSFDDYKPPLYAYLAIPPIALFGLTVWAVRIPSAIMGVLAVIGTYIFVYQLYKNSNSKQQETNKHQATKSKRLKNWCLNIVWDSEIGTWDLPTKIALLSSFLLAISPWHLQFSRIAFEANIGLGLHILGLAAFFSGLKRPGWLVISAFLLGLSLYAYHSERVFVPLLVLVLGIIWRKELFVIRRHVFIAVIVGLITVLPLVPLVANASAMTRLRGTSPLSDQTALLKRTVEKIEADRAQGDFIGELLDNRRIVYAHTLFDGYISHFSLKWLFLTGDNDRHHAPDNGLLYLWELPFMLWGLVRIWQKGGNVRNVLFSWILIAPVAASPTGGTPHAIRTLVFLPAFQIFTACGLIQVMLYISQALKKVGLRRIITGSAICIYAIGIVGTTVFYFHMYYAHMNREYSQHWQYGYKEAVAFARERYSRYEKIVVSTALEQPHMFFLFYTKYDPARYQAEGGTSSGGFKEYRNTFGKFEFRPIRSWEKELHDGSVLYIATPREIPHGAMQSIRYLNGAEAIRIAE